ncbi:Ada metal-binding domain-containing protein [uncultured Deinococcus sp.]|uniref:DNA-3-methyladenine glycosylase 2 n=1 Tax=uncultured Deinococcus sp. TaxID=158789 RepID=UPI0025DFE496|nr:Ada metal-binding domain-containing protein [uncultured Deinococcus sp.]
MTATFTREFMLERMFAADAAFDGLFYTGVTSTGIYCLPSCRARKPRVDNVVFHASAAAAQAAGLRACRRCQPDAFREGVPVEEAGFSGALRQVEVPGVASVQALARALGLSGSALHVQFREHYQCSPAQWLTRERVRLAAARLLDTRETAAQVAFAVGFGSLSAFGAQFRRVMHLTPQALRDSVHTGELRLTLPAGFPRDLVWRDLSRDPLSVTCRVGADRVEFAWAVAGDPQSVTLYPAADQTICVRPTGVETWRGADWLALHGLTVRALGLHGAARPVPLVPDLFDGLIWAVVGQQVTFRQACGVRRELVRHYGVPVGDGLIVPPTPQAVAALTPADLGRLGLTGARAALLHRLAGRIVRGELNLAVLARGTVGAARRTLRAVPGIGPWTAEYVLLRVLGFPDIVPDGDAALAAALRRRYDLPGRPTPAEIHTLLLPCTPYRSHAVLRLWHGLTPHLAPYGDHP